MNTDVQAKVAKFFAAYREHEYQAGSIIGRPGEELPGVLYLVSGRVVQYDISPSGNEVVVNIYKSGAFFPMSAAINHTPNNYFFEVSEPTVARVAPPAEAVQFLKDNPDVLFDLLARVYRGTDGLLRRMAHLMGGDARSRIIFELINAAQRFGEPSPATPRDPNVMQLSLSESDLGKRTGLARETVNRTIQQLKTEGLVEIGARHILLPDMRKLKNVLGEAL